MNKDNINDENEEKQADNINDESSEQQARENNAKENNQQNNGSSNSNNQESNIESEDEQHNNMDNSQNDNSNSDQSNKQANNQDSNSEQENNFDNEQSENDFNNKQDEGNSNIANQNESDNEQNKDDSNNTFNQNDSTNNERSKDNNNNISDQNDNIEKNSSNTKNESSNSQDNTNEENLNKDNIKDENEEKQADKNSSKENRQTTKEELEKMEKSRQEAKDMFKKMSKPKQPQNNNKNDFFNKIDDLNGVPENTIKILIDKFFEKSFKKQSDLNETKASNKDKCGNDKWDVKALITHRVSKNYQPMLNDKKGFTKKSGDGDSIPLAFYFDLSGSMDPYMNILATMGYEMLKHKVKIICGFNQNAIFQIDSIPENCSKEKFAKILDAIGNNIKFCSNEKDINILKQNQSVIKVFRGHPLINEYLEYKKAEKVVVFSDFDPLVEICELSTKCKVYWFAFVNVCNENMLYSFKGNFFRVSEIKDILSHLRNMDNKMYEKRQRKSSLLHNNFNNFER